MNLIWHIVKKDLRRYWPLALVTAGWLFTIEFLLFAETTTSRNFVFSASAGGSFAFAGLFASLIALIVQSDTATDPSAFWRTRPIEPWQLWMAKLWTGFLLGPVMSGLAWFGLLFVLGFRECMPVVNFCAGMSLGVIVIAAIAAVAQTLGRFWLLLLLLCGIFMVGIAFNSWIHGSNPSNAHQVAMVSVLCVGSLVLFWQTLRARSALRCLTACIVLWLTAASAQSWWCFQVPGLTGSEPQAASSEWRVEGHVDLARTGDLAGTISIHSKTNPLFTIGDDIRGHLTWTDATRTPVYLIITPRPDTQTVHEISRLLGSDIKLNQTTNPTDERPVVMHIKMRKNQRPASFSGEARVTRVEYVKLAELPCLAGACFLNDGSFFKVIETDLSDGNASAVITVRSRWLSRSDDDPAHGHLVPNRLTVVLVHRPSGRAWLLDRRRTSNASTFGLRSEIVDYTLPSTAVAADGSRTAEWLAGASLVLIQQIPKEQLSVPINLSIGRATDPSDTTNVKSIP